MNLCAQNLQQAIATSKKAKEEYIELYDNQAYPFFIQTEEELGVDSNRIKLSYFLANRHQAGDKIDAPKNNLRETKGSVIKGEVAFNDCLFKTGYAYYPVKQCTLIVSKAREVGNVEMEMEALRLHQKFGELYVTIESGVTAALVLQNSKRAERSDVTP